MNKFHLILLTCLISTSMAFGMELRKRDMPDTASMNPEQPRRTMPKRAAKKAGHATDLDKPEIVAARNEAETNPDYAREQADAWIREASAQREVSSALESEIRALAKRHQIMITGEPDDAEIYTAIAREELARFIKNK